MFTFILLLLTTILVLLYPSQVATFTVLPIFPSTKKSLNTFLPSIAPKDFKTGLTVIMSGNTPVKILSFQHTKVARGVASTKARLKNLLNNSVLNKVIQASEKFEVANMGKKSGIFSYADNEILYFMDTSTCFEIPLNKSLLNDKSLWLTPGMDITLVTFDEKVIDVLLPPSANYEVLNTPPSRPTGDGKSVKLAELCCGGSVTVPSFVSVGERVSINLETYTYQSRAKGEFRR